MIRRLFFLLSFCLAAPVICAAQQQEALGHIKADRSSLRGVFELPAIDFILSDKLTPDRREFVLRSLKRIPAPGCPEDPSFTLTHVAPMQRDEKGAVWSESFEIDCNPKIRRTRAILATNTGATSYDLVPGETRTHTDINLQNGIAADFSRRAMVAGGPDCRETPLLQDTRFVATVSQSPVSWKEHWLYRVCEKDVEFHVTFSDASPSSLNPKGGVKWTINFPARDVKPPQPDSIAPNPVRTQRLSRDPASAPQEPSSFVPNPNPVPFVTVPIKPSSPE